MTPPQLAVSPKISIILPVRNAEQTILRAVDSILNQTFQDFELIIVENGSTDQTFEIISNISDPRMISSQLTKGNLVQALNLGIAISKGKYIARMDADDYSYPNRLSDQFTFLEENDDYGLVSGLVDYIGDYQTSQGYYEHVQWLNSLISHEDIYNNRFVDAPISHPSVMFRKSLVSEFEGYKDGHFPEDFELWNRWLLKGVKMAKIEKPVIKWYDGSNRLSRTDDRYKEDRFSELKAEYFSKWFKSEFPTQKPDILIWGNGSTVKKKAKHLNNFSLEIKAYIDVVDSISSQTIYFKDLLAMKNIFILNYVSDRKGRVEIYNFLIENGFKEGENFYMMN